MNENTNKLDNLNESFASLEKAIKEVQGCMGNDEMNQKMGNVISSMYASMAALKNQMHDLHKSHGKRMDSHMDGHAPAFKSNKHLQAFLKACDMTDDYTSSPQEIGVSNYANMAYASTFKASKRGLSVEVDFRKPKDNKQ